jgi:hypothetical protein
MASQYERRLAKLEQMLKERLQPSSALDHLPDERRKQLAAQHVMYVIEGLATGQSHDEAGDRAFLRYVFEALPGLVDEGETVDEAIENSIVYRRAEWIKRTEALTIKRGIYENPDLDSGLPNAFAYGIQRAAGKAIPEPPVDIPPSPEHTTQAEELREAWRRDTKDDRLPPCGAAITSSRGRGSSKKRR